MKAFTSGLLTSVSITLICGAWAAPASAQSAPAADTGGIEDIVVTAQRRSERLQDVPITISAVSAQKAEALGIQDTTGIISVVPGLQFNRSLNAGTPFLRGIGNNSAAPGQEAGVATYIDGVYIPIFGNIFSFNNIERVEVLKGPQGTLFGRNAVGGVIQVITKTPQQDPSLDAEVGYANYNAFDGKLYATTGLAPNVAMDVAAYVSHQSKGWGTNLPTNEDVGGNGHEYSVRSKLLAQLGDNTTVTLAGDYSDEIDHTGTPTRLLPGYRGGDGSVAPPHFQDTNNTVTGTNQAKIWGVSARVDQDADFAKLVSITSYRHLHAIVNYDVDLIPANSVTAQFNDFVRTFTQEVQLLSPSTSKIQWIGGLYYFNSVSAYNPFILSGSAFGPAIFQRTRDSLLTDSFAGFGQVTVPIFERTRLTGGLRYTIDDQKIHSNVSTGLSAPGVSARNDQHASFPKLTYRASLDHKLNDDILLFATASRGFKSGVYGATSPTAPAVRPEILDAYELGFKADLFDRKVRFNASGFYYNSKDRQVIQVVGGTSGTLNLNAAAAHIKGIDADVEFQPTKRLNIQLSAEYLHARFTSFPNAPFLTPRPAPAGGLIQTAVDAAGNITPQSPRFSGGANVVYTMPTSIGAIQAAVNYTYSDAYFYTQDNTVKMPQKNLINVSLRWTSNDEKLTAQVWGKNLTNDKYYNNINSSTGGQAGSPAAPITYGVSVGVKFR